MACENSLRPASCGFYQLIRVFEESVKRHVSVCFWHFCLLVCSFGFWYPSCANHSQQKGRLLHTKGLSRTRLGVVTSRLMMIWYRSSILSSYLFLHVFGTLFVSLQLTCFATKVILSDACPKHMSKSQKRDVHHLKRRTKKKDIQALLSCIVAFSSHLQLIM